MSCRLATVTTPAAALLQFVCYETAHPLPVLPPGVVAFTPLALDDH